MMGGMRLGEMTAGESQGGGCYGLGLGFRLGYVFIHGRNNESSLVFFLQTSNILTSLVPLTRFIFKQSP